MSIYIVPHRNCEAVNMKNITVSVDEQTYRLARIRAAEWTPRYRPSCETT